MMNTATAVAGEQPQAPLPPAEYVQRQSTPLLRFPFQKRYGGLYSNRHERFVLREEHIAELKRLVKEHNSDIVRRGEPLTMSDIVGAALDLALEHPLAFHAQVSPENLRDSLGREVCRKAFLHFFRHEML